MVGASYCRSSVGFNVRKTKGTEVLKAGVASAASPFHWAPRISQGDQFAAPGDM